MNRTHPPNNARQNPAAPPPPPPTTYTLKPHHLQLLKLLTLVFHKYGTNKLPAPFLLHIYRILLIETAEVKQPATYAELVEAVDDPTKITSVEAKSLVDEFKKIHKAVLAPDFISLFFLGVPYVIPPRDEDDQRIPLARRSLFGYFARRCFVSFLKLSFEGMTRLFKDYQSWVSGEYHESGGNVKQQDILDNSHNILKTSSDKKDFAEPQTYAFWEKYQATGDNATAADFLRGFFEQHFHEGCDSGLRQHALLNLARMHYLRGETIAAHKVLQEAVMVARSNNDKVTLQHCLGLLHRLPPSRGERPTINEIQPDLHPLEVLSDVKKLIWVGSQQPLAASFEKIVEGIMLYDNYVDIQKGIPSANDQWGHHAVQSVTWNLLGSAQLAGVEEAIVMAFTSARSDDNMRLTVTLNRACRHARQGKYEEAVAMLIHPDVWSGLTFNDYNIWASEIWHILALRASRRGQTRLFHDFLKSRRPHAPFRPRDYWFSYPDHPIGSIIRDPLYEVLSMREVDQAQSVIEPLLISLWHAEYQQRFVAYRVAVATLADVALELGMTKWSRRIIEEIMPQIIHGDDLELRAFACVTCARCIIAAADSNEDVRECLPYLLIAEKDYSGLEIYRSLQDTQFLLSIVYHNLGMSHESEDAASKCHATEAVGKQASGVAIEGWLSDIWEIVSNAGAVLAAR
ncbi:Anaphase-promoting complex subunit 5 [Abortiporus biennis]